MTETVRVVRVRATWLMFVVVLMVCETPLAQCGVGGD